jgi:hypothetical protein
VTGRAFAPLTFAAAARDLREAGRVASRKGDKAEAWRLYRLADRAEARARRIG